MSTQDPTQAVRQLPPETARKIAAGEVIDRPSAIVRELLDNAVDSGATSITLDIFDGGIECIRIADNGMGMTKADLENCAKPHATSKITSETDLLSLSTLGFRGEALASIAAVSRLEITSIRSLDGSKKTSTEHAWKLEADISTKHKLTPAQLAVGTVVQSSGLFENFPARRVFLKRPASEATLCKQVFVEKTIPQKELAFRLNIDGKLKIDLPANQSATERLVCALELSAPPSLFYEISHRDESAGFSYSCILSDTAIHRSDKRQILIYINGRRIWEYGLVQAIEYGSTGYFPNGTYPVACLFVEMDPKLVDFNIHPAKKEARFKDMSSLHHAVSSGVKSFYKNHAVAKITKGIEIEVERPQFDFMERRVSSTTSQSSKNDAHFERDFPKSSNYRSVATFSNPIQSNITENYKPYESSNSTENIKPLQEQVYVHNEFKYVGCALGVFIIIEKNNILYLIDQHAAQERLLYNSFMETIGQKQALMFPYVLKTETEADDAYLQTIIHELEKAGFTIQNTSDGVWDVLSVPIKWNGTEETLVEDLLKNRVQPTELCAKLAATYACRAAIKDGTVLDAYTARELASQALALTDPHCPHGRPLWTTISKQELFKLVRRTE